MGITLTERKTVENDKSKSLHANTIILNLWCWMVYGRYRLHSIPIHESMWERMTV